LSGDIGIVGQTAKRKGKADAYEIEQDGIETCDPLVFSGPQTIKGGKPDPNVYARHPHTGG
jgi:hypothetical protein